MTAGAEGGGQGGLLGSVSAEHRPSFSRELTYLLVPESSWHFIRLKSPVEFVVDSRLDHDLDHKIIYTDTMSYEGTLPSTQSPFPPLINNIIPVEHNIPKNEQTASQHTRRPDLSTFFSNLELVNTSNTQNSNATPMPADMRAVFITLSDAFRSMRSQGGGALLDILIESLEADAEAPPREVEGVSDAYLDGEFDHNMTAAGCTVYRQRGNSRSAFLPAICVLIFSCRARSCAEENHQESRLMPYLWQPFSRRYLDPLMRFTSTD